MSKGAIMFAASASGSGKTLITCGILQVLKNRGMKIASFKCGPDYIDPMFHRRVIGIESSNIDLFFCEENTAKYLFNENSKDSEISVVEGVMGYYDGMSAASTQASSYHVSQTLAIPTVLIVNAKGQGISSLAVLKGMAEFKPNSNILGVIFNNMSEQVYKSIKSEVKSSTGITPLGYLPKVKDLTIESRHLGLVTPEEIEGLSEKLNRLAEILEETVEIDSILELSTSYKGNKAVEPDFNKTDRKPVIAVARDEAFCFYYKDNINLLKKMGADIVEFSPIHDKTMPEEADGLILGGGYPELYCNEIFENKSMMESVKAALKNGMPCLAECGGFMCLNEKIEDMNGNEHEAIGIISGKAYKTDKLGRFGYITLTAKYDSWLMEKGETIRGHEFHYFDSDNCGSYFKAEKPVTKKSWNCINIENNVVAGFPHLFYYSNPRVAERFLSASIDYREKRKGKVKWQKQL